jgi:pantetheine-phosphate adenylyltransferase
MNNSLKDHFQDHFPENKNQERIATIGGTFDTLHTGHKEYIRLAFEYADRVIIYVTSDEYVNGKKKYSVRPYASRVEELEYFIQSIECDNRYQIRCLHNQDELINDYLKRPDLKEKIYMAIVSPEYYDFFLELNRLREAQGLKSFLILVKPRSYNPLNNDISSYEVRKRLPCPENFESSSENVNTLST